MTATLDDLVDPALALVRGVDGEPVGTAFRVLAEGAFLTCDHVARAAAGGSVELADGSAASIGDAELDPRRDLALLDCPDAGGVALPVEVGVVPDAYWTKGYAWTSESLPFALPLHGPVAGKTAELRYAHEDRNYAVSWPLVLGEQHAFAPGLSGAPVLDPAQGVVVAVAVAEYLGGAPYDGFGVTLDGACEAIAGALRRNRRLVPRHGALLNSVGATLICGAHTSAVVRAMTASERVKPDLHVRRAALVQVLAEFRAGEAPVLALVGASGVGKTAELVEIATGAEETAVLLEAATLAEPAAGGLGGVEIADEDRGGGVTLDRIAAACAEDGRLLLVCVDGLNEAPPPLSNVFPQWTGATLAWLQERPNVRLVTSWRDEAWAQVERLWPKAVLHGGRPVLLGNFELEEAAEALRRYGIVGRGIQAADARYPFLVRIYGDLAESGAGIDRMSVLDAVDAYLEWKCGVVAARRGSTLSSTIRAVLERVAAAPALGELRVPRDAVLAAAADDITLADLLVDEHVLVAAPGGYRFAFDQAGEFLAARSLEPTQAADGIVAAFAEADVNESPAGPYVFALLDLEREGRTEELAAALEAVVRAFRGGDRWNTRLFVAVLPLLLRLDDPDALLPALSTWAEALVEAQLGFLLAARVRETRLSPAARLALLHVVVRELDYYGAREKDWPVATREQVRTNDVWRALHEELAGDPRAALTAFRAWLDDRTKLQGGEATVADLAFALLCLEPAVDEVEFFDTLASRDLEHDRYLWLLAQRRAEAAPGHCHRWLDLGDESRRRAVVECAQAVLRSTAQAKLRLELLDCVREVRRAPTGTDAGIVARGLAAQVLAEHRETALEVAAETLADLRDGVYDNAWPAAMAVRLAPERMLPELLEVASSRPMLAASVADVVETLPLDREDEAAVVALLNDAARRGTLSGVELAIRIEARLAALSDAPASDALVETMERLAVHPDSDVRRVIGYFRNRDDLGPEAERLRARLNALLAGS